MMDLEKGNEKEAPGKKQIDEAANFEELKDVINAAFFEPNKKNNEEAVELIKNPEYGFLIDRVEDKANILFDVMHDKIYGADFNNKNWKQTANTLNKILGAIKDNWSTDMLHRVVNHIGASVTYKNISDPGQNQMEEKNVMETLRDMIEHDDTYRDNITCRTVFNDIFRKYNMAKREDFSKRGAYSFSNEMRGI